MGDAQQSFIRGGSVPGSSLLPFYIPYWTEKVSPSYTFHWQMVPLSHVSVERCIHFNCRKCTIFMNQSKNQEIFLTFFTAINSSINPFRSFYRRKDGFPHPSVYFNRVKFLPFHIPEAWNRYPFRTELPRIGIPPPLPARGWLTPHCLLIINTTCSVATIFCQGKSTDLQHSQSTRRLRKLIQVNSREHLLCYRGVGRKSQVQSKLREITRTSK